MGTHTISNSSTFRGWLESMGIDDMIFDPCGCIMGETQPDPVPIPGARFDRQMSQQSSQRNSRNASMRQSRHGKNPAGRTQSNEPPMAQPPENTAFSAFFSIVGLSSNEG